MIIPVTATERSRPDFYAATPLGLSLSRLRFDSRILTPTVAFDNRPTNAVGLPRIFNQAIQSATTDDILIFTHDDVWIDDYFVVDRLRDGLARYDVIGVAGNRRRLPNQAAWAFWTLALIGCGLVSNPRGTVQPEWCSARSCSNHRTGRIRFYHEALWLMPIALVARKAKVTRGHEQGTSR